MFDNSHMKINSGKETGNTSKTGPSGKPEKDFKKILRKEEREGQKYSEDKETVDDAKTVKKEEGYEEVAAALETVETPKQKKISLFDLAGTGSKEPVGEEISVTVEEQEELPIAEFSEKLQKESLSALFQGYGSKEKLKSLQQQVQAQPDSKLADTELAPKKTDPSPVRGEPAVEAPFTPPSKVVERERSSTKFPQEQPDLSSINPIANTQTPVSQPSGIQAAAPPRSSAAQMQEIVDQIIQKLYTVSTYGRTDTLVTLRHPPLFAGASVILTSFDTAKGEFNITFENLTQAAKQVLDMRSNQDSLKLALEQKGYIVHIITATTLSETTDLVSGRSNRDNRERDARSDDGRQQKEQEEEK